ncbi:hypothetical protein PGT21_023066 [Puccinia graminis f. sp. tritici]|uniref:Uncharacterized protein n=1 Tax=Puccinia graminis f. sp. tritici TaxID=56615 RepID=A0A5B0MLL6_PUCGR|nr:hypothetical protein PGT21_023066 [Puccinia graminis f. sp. tritici]
MNIQPACLYCIIRPGSPSIKPSRKHTSKPSSRRYHFIRHRKADLAILFASLHPHQTHRKSYLQAIGLAVIASSIRSPLNPPEDTPPIDWPFVIASIRSALKPPQHTPPINRTLVIASLIPLDYNNHIIDSQDKIEADCLERL